MAGTPYKKDWLVSTGIARGMISMHPGGRVPTVNEYCEAFGCSRGVVQNALAGLNECGAIALSKRGKQGTYLTEKNDDLLFKNAGLQFMTGSMPTPLNMHLAGLATGICQAMSRCSVPFTFAFVQGAKNRVEALSRGVYDFIVVTRSTASEHIRENPDLEEAFPLSGCRYSPPYALYINRRGVSEIQDGMTVALDPACRDQYRLTHLLCAGRDVRLIEMPYISSRQAFLSGEVDALVFRDDSSPGNAYLGGFMLNPKWLSKSDEYSVAPIALSVSEDMQLPVVLVNKKNYGMAGILKSYLGGELVSFIQKKVIDQQMAPQFY